MIDMKAGPAKKPYKRTPRIPKYDPSQEATAEDLQAAAKKAAPKERRIIPGQKPAQWGVGPKEIPKRIEVKQSASLREVVPGSVWRQSAFKWDPMTFACESEKLNKHIIEPRVQNES